MKEGTINLTVGEIQGHLRQMAETRQDLSAEERYSLMAALETMSFLQKISPGLAEAMKGQKRGTIKPDADNCDRQHILSKCAD